MLLVVLAAAALNLASHAQEPSTPIGRYKESTHYATLLCATKFRVAQLAVEGQANVSEDATNWLGCLVEMKAAARVNFDAAMASMKKKPKAQDALKVFHVRFVAALEGIAPGPDERKISYQQRQAQLQDRMTEAWALVELEI